MKVNCAALPQDLLESGAVRLRTRRVLRARVGEKPGKFELADQGSILLDEIGEMSPNLQAKLLHVLQDGEYTRLGGGARCAWTRACWPPPTAAWRRRWRPAAFARTSTSA